MLVARQEQFVCFLNLSETQFFFQLNEGYILTSSIVVRIKNEIMLIKMLDKWKNLYAMVGGWGGGHADTRGTSAFCTSPEGFCDLQPSVIHGSAPTSASLLTEANQVIGHWPCQNGFAHTCHEGSGDETLKPSRTLQSLVWYKILCVPDFLFGFPVPNSRPARSLIRK